MIIYSITYNVEKEVQKEWLEWMRVELIPEMMDFGTFDDFKILRLVNEVAGTGITYSLQFIAPTMAHVDQYLLEKESEIMQKVYKRYSGKFVEFRTILEQLK